LLAGRDEGLLEAIDFRRQFGIRNGAARACGVPLFPAPTTRPCDTPGETAMPWNVFFGQMSGLRAI